VSDRDYMEENAEAEAAELAHLQNIDKLNIQSTTPKTRSGEFTIKVVGDPYIMFAKAPKDIP
jgi:hypothetical protein